MHQLDWTEQRYSSSISSSKKKKKNQVQCKPACTVQSAISVRIQFSNQLSCKEMLLHQETLVTVTFNRKPKAKMYSSIIDRSSASCINK